ncbi:MBL fold metallo-hydrolase, partial [Chloroflexota bacterium]
MEVIPGVYQLGVRWANVILLVGEEITLVDTGWGGSSKKILNFINQLGRSPSDITRIIITHDHIDHAGNVAQLQKLCAARVAVHKADAPYVSGERRQPIPISNKALAFPLRPFRPVINTEPATVDIILEDGDEFDSPIGLKVIHTPGHTPGSICLLSEEKSLLIIGDALNNRRGRLSFQT